jgi:hypothetical protein
MFTDTIKPKEIVYPISLSYVPEWGAWEVIRELVSNAIDTRTAWSMTREADDLVITDSGTGLVIRQLLFGVSEKADSNAIGQFGEGLKLAMLVLTRMGLTARVSSGVLRLWNEVEEIGGEACLKLCFTDNNELFLGTEVFIQGWGAENPIFEERFVQDSDILYKTEAGQLLSQCALYVKGVYVCDLPDYEWGYNLLDTKMNRDRSAVSEWDVKYGIGEVWSKITDSSCWKVFFEAVNDGTKEREINIENLSEQAEAAMQEGFLAQFGKNAVLSTTITDAVEAKHRGAVAVECSSFGYYLRNTLAKIVETDVKYIMRKAGMKAYNVPASDLTPEEQQAWSAVKRLAKKCGYAGKLRVFKKEGVGGLWDPNTPDIIFIHVNSLYSTMYAKAVFIHELGHCESHAADNTDAHMNAVCAIAARLAS